MKEQIYSYNFAQLTDYLVDKGFKKFKAEQIFNWLYAKEKKSFQEMRNLPKDFIAFLDENFEITLPTLVIQNKSKDGTEKFLYALADGALIECVLMHHDYGLSLCVTTQVGCSIGCSFCASGILKKKRDLTTAEIVGQVMKTQEIKQCKINSVVIMGIGEPFDNFANVMTFIDILNYPKGLNIGQRRITVSTSGLVPKIKAFADRNLQVNLALSFHAPFDDLRSQIMKINTIFSISKLIEALDYYLAKTNRRVTIEYILINELTDTVECAKELVKLFKSRNVYINLIPYNEVKEVAYKRSTPERQKAFFNVLKNANMDAILRKEQGHDINAACGQLRSEVLKKHEHKDGCACNS